MSTVDAAKAEGRVAYSDDKEKTDNPYTEGSPEHSAWHAGFDEAAANDPLADTVNAGAGDPDDDTELEDEDGDGEDDGDGSGVETDQADGDGESTGDAAKTDGEPVNDGNGDGEGA